MKTKIISIAVLSLIAAAGCNKSNPVLKVDVPNPVKTIDSTGASDPRFCSSIIVVNHSDYDYGYYNTDASGNPIHTGDYNEANLTVGFTYNVWDSLNSSFIFAPTVLNLGGGLTYVAPAAPAFGATIAQGDQYEMDLVYNNTWPLSLGSADTYQGTLSLQAVSQSNSAASQDLSFAIAPDASTGEGYCGTMVTYYVGNGGQDTHHNSGLRKSNTGHSSTVYNVRADAMAALNMTAAPQAKIMQNTLITH